MTTLFTPSPVTSINPAAGWKIDAHRGQLIGTVSRQWQARPDDQKFLSLADLDAFLRDRSNRNRPCPASSGRADRARITREAPPRPSDLTHPP